LHALLMRVMRRRVARAHAPCAILTSFREPIVENCLRRRALLQQIEQTLDSASVEPFDQLENALERPGMLSPVLGSAKLIAQKGVEGGKPMALAGLALNIMSSSRSVKPRFFISVRNPPAPR
jgi:hypothetical protein